MDGPAGNVTAAMEYGRDGMKWKKGHVVMHLNLNTELVSNYALSPRMVPLSDT